MIKLLVIGFGNFQQYSENPSGDLAELVNGLTYYDIKVVGCKIDVDWKRSWPEVLREVINLQPACVVAIGQAEDPFIRLEKTAKNLTGKIYDNQGNLPEHTKIVIDAPDTYTSTLPTKWLEETINNNSPNTLIRARVSEDAGDYLCNFIFYNIMHYLDEMVPFRGFVHIPPYPINDSSLYTRNNVISQGVFTIKQIAKWLGQEI